MNKDPLLSSSEDRDRENFKINIKEGMDINVFLIKLEINDSTHKYIMLKCKKEQIQKKSEKLSINHYKKWKFDIPSNKHNYIIEINKEVCATFIRFFDNDLKNVTDDDYTNIESLGEKDEILISELRKKEKSKEEEEKKKKKKKKKNQKKE